MTNLSLTSVHWNREVQTYELIHMGYWQKADCYNHKGKQSHWSTAYHKVEGVNHWKEKNRMEGHLGTLKLEE